METKGRRESLEFKVTKEDKEMWGSLEIADLTDKMAVMAFLVLMALKARKEKMELLTKRDSQEAKGQKDSKDLLVLRAGLVPLELLVLMVSRERGEILEIKDLREVQVLASLELKVLRGSVDRPDFLASLEAPALWDSQVTLDPRDSLGSRETVASLVCPEIMAGKDLQDQRASKGPLDLTVEALVELQERKEMLDFQVSLVSMEQMVASEIKETGAHQVLMDYPDPKDLQERMAFPASREILELMERKETKA